MTSSPMMATAGGELIAVSTNLNTKVKIKDGATRYQRPFAAFPRIRVSALSNYVPRSSRKLGLARDWRAPPRKQVPCL